MAVKKLKPFYKHTPGHRRVWAQHLQKLRVQLVLLVKVTMSSAPPSPSANMLYHPHDGCCLVLASSKLQLHASFIRESRLHFRGRCHTAGLGQKAGNNVGTQAETLTSHWKAFPPPQSIPPPKRKANTMLISSMEISHTFSPAMDRGQSPSNTAHMEQSIFTPT